MQVDLTLLKVPERQLANRQVALGIDPANGIYTFENVKMNGNHEQVVDVPWVDGLETANMAYADGMFFDIISWDNTTFENRQMRLTLKLEPFATYLPTDATLFGWLEKTPILVHRGARINIGFDALKASSSFMLPTLPIIGGMAVNWVEVVATEDIETSDPSRFTIYGFPIFYRNREYVHTTEQWLTAKPGFPSEGAKRWPSLLNAMVDIDQVVGIPADSIQTVSVSPRCPWDYTLTGFQFYLQNYGGPEADGSDQIKAGTVIPELVVSKIMGKGVKPATPYIGTLHLSDFERLCGTVSVLDQSFNEVAQVPTEFFDLNNRLQYSVESISDITGLYTQISLFDTQSVITLTEGKLPWTGSAWDEYVRRNIEYDREMLSIQTRQTNEQFEIDTVEAAANAMLTLSAGSGALLGAPVAAASAATQTALEIGAAYLRKESGLRAAESAQLAAEGRMKNMPSSNFAAGYGLNFLQWGVNPLGGARFVVRTPANISETDFNNWVQYVGYPCGKVASCPVVTGYVKGNIYSMGPAEANIPGIVLSLMRNELANGIRMVVL